MINFLVNKAILIGIIIGVIIAGVAVVFTSDVLSTPSQESNAESEPSQGKRYTVELRENIGVSGP